MRPLSTLNSVAPVRALFRRRTFGGFKPGPRSLTFSKRCRDFAGEDFSIGVARANIVTSLSLLVGTTRSG